MAAGVIAALAAALAGLALGPLLAELARAVPRQEPVRPRWRADRRTVVAGGAAGALAALVTVAWGGSALLAAQLWLVGLAVVLTTTDLQHHRLPNALVLPGGAVLAALVAVGAVVDGRPGDLVGAAVAAAVLFGVFLLAAVVSPSGLGMGDVKLAGVLGVPLGLLGAGPVLIAVLVAFGLHAVVSVVLLAARRATRSTALPFGPALLAGAGVGLGWLGPLL